MYNKVTKSISFKLFKKLQYYKYNKIKLLNIKYKVIINKIINAIHFINYSKTYIII